MKAGFMYTSKYKAINRQCLLNGVYYNYRLYDRYRSPIASLAVLANEHPNWRPQQFTYSVLGCETSIHFPIAKLIDYQDQLDAFST